MEKKVVDKRAVLNCFCRVFNRLDIPYVLIGAYAVAAWGVVRATKDIDFLASIPLDKLDAVKDNFRKDGFQVDVTFGDIADPISGVMRLKYDSEVIDVLLGIKGVSNIVFERAINLSIMGMSVPVLSPEDTIIVKLLAGGVLDIDDAKKVFCVMKDRIDLRYLEDQCRKMGLDLTKIK